MDFKTFIRDINDFPKEGIVFKDITPLFGKSNVLNEAGRIQGEIFSALLI